ncbi:OsmC family protein [Heyndrickxia acidicola]|uniref:OsmC family protein n=1 Tax=Heyndrickxia acidicola TaxID=209389 RepID=A0ABU6MI10_9BACI|nr:OsmC family protein [Heyndrickxia acidicola]MED1204304.1 OsmC family protein [Heyndrickxia acidicola]
MAEHHFHLTAEWPGGRNSVGIIDAGNLKTKVSIPPEMDGPGIGTNPDEMLLGAASTCYIITLAAMLERSSIETRSLSLESEAVVEVIRGVNTFKRIVHRPFIVLPSESSKELVEKVQKLAEKAESSCMISKAVMGNVELALEVKITCD